MKIAEALTAVMHGSSLQQIAADCRAEKLAALGLRPDEADATACSEEVASFMRTFARHLGDRHSGNPRVCQALRDWVRQCDHYEAWDSLLSGFEFEGRPAVLRRGRQMFPGPLTAHWADHWADHRTGG